MSTPATENLDAFLSQLANFTLWTRRRFLGQRQGQHISLRKGHGIEFSDYRKYELGDNPRYIDWSAYARSDKLVIKRFNEEEDISLSIIVDGSASMSSTMDNRKWLAAATIATGLGYIALNNRETLRLNIAPERQNYRFSSLRDLTPLKERLFGFNPTGEINLNIAIGSALSQIKRPGKLIFISDCLYPIPALRTAWSLVTAKNFELEVIAIKEPLTGSNIPFGDFCFIDSENGDTHEIGYSEYESNRVRQLAGEHYASLQNIARQLGIGLQCYTIGEDLLQLFGKVARC